MSTPDGRCGGQPDGSGRRPPVLRNGLVMGICIQDVIDGMKLQPCNPNFLQARDAILLADENNYAGRNVCRWWRGFAKRGMGVLATSTGTRVTEDFSVPTECA